MAKNAHCLDLDKLVRRARSLGMTTSYTHKLDRHDREFRMIQAEFQRFLSLKGGT